MYCPHCGTKNIDGARYCTRCGANLASSLSPLAAHSGRIPAGIMLDRRYEIISHVSTGGFGRVYKAKDARFNALVAIKEMVGEFDTEEERKQLERYFQQEAQVLFSLKHPSLPKVTDYFFEQDRFFLVMDYIEGDSLMKIMEARGGAPLEEAKAREWFFHLLTIMDYLHSQNPPIIHRDIKPDNLIWQEWSNSLFLVDFGIIRIGCSTRTQSYGTPGYASPEQAGGSARPSVDIYSAGATLHHLLSGNDPAERPFDFESLHVLRPDISPRFAETVDRMVAIRVRERFHDAQEVRRFFIAGEDDSTPATPPADQPEMEDEEDTLNAAAPVELVSPVNLPGPVNPSSPESPLPAIQPVEEIPHTRDEEQWEKSGQLNAQWETGSPVQKQEPEGCGYQPVSADSVIPVIGISEDSQVPVQSREEDTHEPLRPVRPQLPDSPIFVPEGLVFECINPQGFELYRHYRSESLFVWIPGGKYLMGAHSQDRDARNDEKPLHEVAISGFWMGTMQVNNRQYAKFLSYSGYNTTSDWEEYRQKSGETYPVVMVSREDAMAYCAWSGGILPSEAQWEKAARGFDDRIFPWGSFLDNNRFNCWDSPQTALRAHFFEEKGPTPGGSHPGGDSPFGCADMAGNVWEWTRDTYDEHYYRSSPDSDPCNDGRKSDYAVVRGGSWHVIPRDCRVSRRLRSHISHTANDRGFRCAIVP